MGFPLNTCDENQIFIKYANSQIFRKLIISCENSTTQRLSMHMVPTYDPQGMDKSCVSFLPGGLLISQMTCGLGTTNRMNAL